MMIYDTRVCGVLSLMGLLSMGCGDPNSSGVEPIGQVGQSLEVVVASKTQTAIENAIAAAQPGDTVVFPNGTYPLTRAFQFKSGVAFKAATGAVPVLSWPANSDTLGLEHEGFHDITITGLQFKNVRLNFEKGATAYTTCSNIYLKNLKFSGGKRSDTDWSGDGYIRFGRCDGVVVDGCTLQRAKPAAPAPEQGGPGIRLYRAHNAIVKDSFIGTDKNLADGAPQGYFRTAVNVFGAPSGSEQSENIKIHNTIARRVHNPVCACEGELDEDGEPRSATCCEDHGVYAAFYDGFEATRNVIDGWSAGSSGAAFKLRNSDNSIVFRNRMMRSGIISYTYGDSGEPLELYNVHVRGNRIDMRLSEQTCDYCGLYYRLYDDADPAVDESEVYWLANTFPDGGALQVTNGNGPGFCVEDNVGATEEFTPAGVRTTDCSPGSSWDLPLAGVFTGNFNDDGVPDLATRISVDDTEGEAAREWRVYVSDGDHYRMEDWGDGTYLDTDTELYGVHVGDFTENGRDDIMYRGKCGNGDICWRVHASTGSGFDVKYGFGDGVYHSDETFRFGFHVGDFDGDGHKDDLVYRGKCGSPGIPCWRVHKSDGASFSTHDFGDDAVWYEDESETYGLLIGNFDGDAAGKDDIAYLGKCGTARCLRVHLSTGTAFVYQSAWSTGNGASPSFDGAVSEHFGLRVGDKNKDGKADIAYRGACSTTKGWRYHTSNGTSFTKSGCVSTYDF